MTYRLDKTALSIHPVIGRIEQEARFRPKRHLRYQLATLFTEKRPQRFPGFCGQGGCQQKSSEAGGRWTCLEKFVFQSGGCFGSGGPTQPGVNYLAKPWNVHLVGTIKVGSDGKFSVKNAKSTYKVAVQGSTQSTVTTASVSGKFTNRKTATGTITYSQAYSQPGVPGSSCGPVKLTFKATVK